MQSQGEGAEDRGNAAASWKAEARRNRQGQTLTTIFLNYLLDNCLDIDDSATVASPFQRKHLVQDSAHPSRREASTVLVYVMLMRWICYDKLLKKTNSLFAVFFGSRKIRMAGYKSSA
jgi:hypothetical protein